MTIRRSTSTGLIAIALAALLASPTGFQNSAFAESDEKSDVSALRNHDVDQPISIEAASLKVDERQNSALFSGKVEAVQGRMTLRSERLEVLYAGLSEDQPEILRLDAAGGVRLVSPSEDVTGDWGIYDVRTRLITLGGSVKLTRGTTVITGNRLELNLETGQSQLFGNPKSQRSGRVQGTFSVPDSTK